MTKTRDFIILGPRLVEENKVLEVIHALYFLPENFKLIFTGREPVDETLQKQVAALVERDGLGHRVLFFSDSRAPHAVVAEKGTATKNNNAVAGESAEAIASAILKIARA